MFFKKFVKALFYREYGRLLGDVDCAVGLLTSKHADLAIRQVDPTGHFGREKELIYAGMQCGDDERSMQWLFMLYRTVVVAVWTGDETSAAPAPTALAPGVIVGGNPDYDSEY